MKARVKGVRYNTETSTALVSWNERHGAKKVVTRRTLYVARNGKTFIHNVEGKREWIEECPHNEDIDLINRYADNPNEKMLALYDITMKARTKKVMTRAYLDKKTHEKLKKLADSKGCSVAVLVEEIIEQALRESETKQ
jgi:hypothetical protein